MHACRSTLEDPTLALLLPVVLPAVTLVACAGGPSESLEDPFPGQREEPLRTEECPARLTIDVSAVDIATDERLVEDLSRELRAKGSPDPTADAVAQLEDVRPFLGDARRATVSLVADATDACSYRTFDSRTNQATAQRARIVKARAANGGKSVLSLRVRAELGSRALLWLDLPLESSSARSIVVDTVRTPAAFAQTEAHTIVLGTFRGTTSVVE